MAESKRARIEPKSACLAVDVAATKDECGHRAAEYVIAELKSILKEQGSARVIFATGASQFAFYESLLKGDEGLKWEKVTCFHLDEYCAIGTSHPASFRKYLNERFFCKRSFAAVHLLSPDGNDRSVHDRICDEYGALLAAAPIDMACIGVGENGHIAFQDPPVADFNDPKLVKVVELDAACKAQQVGEGWFASPAQVPDAASLTCPAIMSARKISVVCPDARKAAAVKATLCGPISTACPGSILRRHTDVRFFLDDASAALWRGLAE